MKDNRQNSQHVDQFNCNDDDQPRKATVRHSTSVCLQPAVYWTSRPLHYSQYYSMWTRRVPDFITVKNVLFRWSTSPAVCDNSVIYLTCDIHYTTVNTARHKHAVHLTSQKTNLSVSSPPHVSRYHYSQPCKATAWYSDVLYFQYSLVLLLPPSSRDSLHCSSQEHTENNMLQDLRLHEWSWS